MDQASHEKTVPNPKDDTIIRLQQFLEHPGRQRQVSSEEEKLVQMGILRQAQQPISVEEALTRAILDPQRVQLRRTVLAPVREDGMLSEIVESTLVNKTGVLQETHAELFPVLSDGTSLAPNGVSQCQTCFGIVKETNLKRCPCGITCCVRRGCSRGNGQTTWYCSRWHWFLGTLGLPLR